MPGNAIVGATEEMLMMLPPRPASPSGRIVRSPHFRPSAVPRTLTSSIVRMSFGSTSVIRLLISTPALLTSTSSPPKSEAAAVVAFSQLASFVTSRWTKAWPSPLRQAGADAGPIAFERVGDLLPRLVLPVADDDSGAVGGERAGHALTEPLHTPG